MCLFNNVSIYRDLTISSVVDATTFLHTGPVIIGSWIGAACRTSIVDTGIILANWFGSAGNTIVSVTVHVGINALFGAGLTSCATSTGSRGRSSCTFIPAWKAVNDYFLRKLQTFHLGQVTVPLMNTFYNLHRLNEYYNIHSVVLFY